MHHSRRWAVLVTVLTIAQPSVAQVSKPAIGQPRVAPPPSSLSPAMTDAVVCAARPSAAGPVFRCKGRAAIQRDVGKVISPDWGARFEKDYRDIAGLLGIDPTKGSFAVCPQGGAFTRVDLPSALGAGGASRSDIRPVAGQPASFDVTGAAARAIDAGCGSAGGGIGDRGEYTGDKARGGHVTFGDFIGAGGRLDSPQWSQLTRNTAALFGGMSCRAGGSGGLASAGGGPGLFDQIFGAIAEVLGSDGQGDRSANSAKVGANIPYGLEAPRDCTPDGTTCTDRKIMSDGTYYERSWEQVADLEIERSTELKPSGERKISTQLSGPNGHMWRSDKEFDSQGKLQEERVIEWDDSSPSQIATVTTTYFDDKGKPRVPGGGGAHMPAPDQDRSCAGRQAWVEGFVSACNAVNWQSTACFQAVLIANQCTDPREMTPTPDSPEMICRNAGKGPAFSSREQSCRQRSLIALAYPDAGGGRDCAATPGSSLRPIGGPQPGLVNPVRDGINDRPAKGTPLPTCDPRNPGCAPKPQG